MFIKLIKNFHKEISRMIVYDTKIVDNEILVDEATALCKGGFISKEQKKFIKNELPVFKSQHNILVRIGFFLLGSFLYGSICGAISIDWNACRECLF